MTDITVQSSEVKSSELIQMPVIDISRVFEWGGRKIRVAGTSEKLWFHGADIAGALGYANPGKAILNHVRERNKCSGLDISRSPEMGNLDKYEKQAIFINESGMYSLIMKSKLKEAEAFQDWVTDIVLPSIRRTGGYQVNAEVQRLTSELTNQRLLTDNTERARKEAEEVARIERSRADNLQSENSQLKDAINIKTENEKKWNDAMDTSPPKCEQYMYVAASTVDMMKSLFKVGGVGEASSLQSRLTNYNSSRAEADQYFYVWFGKCHNYRMIEEGFWTVCERFRDKQDTKKEIVRLRFEHVIDVLQNLIDRNQTIIESYTDQYAEFRRSTVIDVPNVCKRLEIPGGTEKKTKSAKVEKIDASKLAATDLHTLIISVLNDEIRKSIPNYDFNLHAKTMSAKFNWVDISQKFSEYSDSAKWWQAKILEAIKNTLVKMTQRRSKTAAITIVTTSTTTIQESTTGSDVENLPESVDG